MVSPEPVSNRRFPGWFPGEGAIAALVVLGLILLLIPWRHASGVNRDPGNDSGGDIAAISDSSGGEFDRPTPIPTATGQVSVAEVPTESPVQTSSTAVATEVPPAATSTVLTTVQQPAGALLPENRVLSYYGFPGEPNMGILGEHRMLELHGLLEEQGAEYEAADPGTPVVLAFEVITSIAQPWETDDGDWLHYIDEGILQEYVDYTATNGLLLILDMQFGRASVQDELAFARPWLEYPHVHLALDPEFAVAEGEVPGQVVGSITAADVMYAQEQLAALSAELGIPPKMLIVHQFTRGSVSDRQTITPMSGVQLVIEVDGFGTPEEKRGTYDYILEDTPSNLVGFKLWYDQDIPLMTASEVVGLDPSPQLVIYQ